MNVDRLDSWKEIASYLDKGVRTVQRWEKLEGLPVRRHAHEKLGSVYASKEEIDAWWESRRADLDTSGGTRNRGAVRKVRWLLGSLAVSALGAGVILLWPILQDVEQHALVIPSPLTTLPGSEYFPSFSPDGNQVAFTWISPGRPVDIYTKAIGTEAVRRITDSEAVDLAPAWSPDGRWIAFLRGERIRGPDREVLVIPSIGGAERKVGVTRPDWGPFIAWTADSSGLIYSNCGDLPPCVLTLVSLETLQERQLTSPPVGQGGDTAPALSPDGRRLLFVRRRGGHTARIFLQNLTDDGTLVSTPDPITPEHVFATAPTWSSDGRSFFYMSGEVGVSMNLWRMEPSAVSTPRLIATLGDTFFEPGLTIHGDRLIAMDVAVDSNVKRLSLAQGRAPAPAVVLTRSNRIDTYPHLSPDGHKVAFQSTRYRGSDIFVMDVDGSGVVQLTSFGLALARTPRWRPDGEEIVFAAGEETGDIFLVDAAGGEPTALIQSASDKSLPTWSPDGAFVYYTSNQTGRYEVWKVASSGGDAIQVTEQGGYRPIASPDGKYVYYTKRTGAPHGSPLWRIRVEGGDEERVSNIVIFHPENFDVGTETVYYSTASSAEGTKGVRAFDLASGRDQEMGHIGPSPSTGLSMSADGSTLVFSHVDTQESDLVMLDIK